MNIEQARKARRTAQYAAAKALRVCPICGTRAWAKSSANLSCGDCSVPMLAKGSVIVPKTVTPKISKEFQGRGAKCELTVGDAFTVLKTMASSSIDLVLTSPPYHFLRDYGVAGQIGLERNPVQFVARLVEVFDELHRILKPTGSAWLNVGDTYSTRRTIRVDGMRSAVRGGPMRSWADSAKLGRTILPSDVGMPEGNQLLLPHALVGALRERGWIVRSTVVWEKSRVAPKKLHLRAEANFEYVFLLTKRAAGYTYNRLDDVERGSVWRIAPAQPSGEHTAVMPDELAGRCIRIGSNVGDTVLDPFAGTGTTGRVANRLGRHARLIELSPTFAEIAMGHIAQSQGQSG